MAHPTPFLDQVITFLHRMPRDAWRHMALVVPTYAVGNKLLRSLGRTQDEPTWAPHVYTLPTFVQHLSDLHVPPRLALLRHLYETAHALGITQDRFEDFMAWGHTLLADFDTLDQTLTSPEELLAHPTMPHRVAEIPSAVQAFWCTMPSAPSDAQTRWETLWRSLPTLYEKYTERLVSHALAYQGLQRRMLCQALAQGTAPPTHPTVTVVGLSCLSRAEERIFALLRSHTQCLFAWDEDPYYCQEVPDHPAGYGYRQRRDKPFLAQAFPTTFTSSLQQAPPDLKVVGAQGLHGQLQALTHELTQRLATASLPLAHTAIVIPDATFLTPVLHALPDTLATPHIQGGYPLTETPAYTLLVALLRYQIAWHETQGHLTQPLVEALHNLCVHPYLRCSPGTTQQLLAAAHQDPRDLPRAAESLGLVAACFQFHADLFQGLQACLQALQATPHVQATLDTWEKVALHTTQTVWRQLQSVWPADLSPPHPTHAWLRILHTQAQPTSLPLRPSDHLDALTIAPLSQTLGLDFSHLFILGMNEGLVPSVAAPTSFVPQPLQKAFGWPTAQAREARTAYPLHRLLQRARHVFCTYDQDNPQAPRSRYLYAWPYTLGWSVQETTWTPPTTPTPSPQGTIPKTPVVMEKLAAFLTDAEGKAARVLTPSALNLYLDCPRCFYLQYIARLKPTVPRTAEMDPSTFGHLFHTLMEELYRPHVHRQLNKAHFDAMTQPSPASLQALCERLARTTAQAHGTTLVVEKVLYKLAQRILTLDQAYAPFTLLALEHNYDQAPLPFPLTDGTKVALGGILDRVDRQGPTVRVLDYKTGTFDPAIPSIDSLFDPTHPTRNRVALQLLWYAWLYDQHHPHDPDVHVMPGVITTRMPWQTIPHVGFTLRTPDAAQPTPLTSIRPHANAFAAKLREVLDTLFDPAIPFVPAPSNQHPPYGPCHTIGS